VAAISNRFDVNDFMSALSGLRKAWDEAGPKRRHKPRTASPNGLRTAREAAAKLGCSIKTLNAHIREGALRYVVIGRGMKRPRRMFTDADLDAFIEAQTRKDSPCPSDATHGRHSGNTTSKSEVIAFSEAQRRRPGAKRKR
jgi:hypothetical protein